MKVNFISLLLLTLTCWIFDVPAITIISQNLQCGQAQIHERIGRLVEQVMTFKADVVALQEVCSDESLDVALLMKQQLMRHGFAVKFFDRLFTHLGYEHFEEELVIFSRLDVDEATKGYLPYSPLQRGYLAIHIGQNWYVNTHLTHESEASTLRFQQMEFLAKKYSGQSAIILGDFNAGPNERESQAFLGHKYHPYFPGPTWPSRAPLHSYDGFWCNFLPPLPPTTHLLEDIGSDHLGITLNFL